MADDTGIQNQPFHVFVGHGGHRNRIEMVEGLAIVLTLFQNGDPRQPGLLAFKANHFKQFFTVGFRHAPFLVVIIDIKLILAYPAATLHRSSPFLIR
ncbi:Uncharacterised protein [Enterobacter cloacae]|nr:Uncharacterised protein [Enterobacter cloacae]